MHDVMIVETRDAAEHRGPDRMAALAIGLSQEGVQATIFLTENAVFAARRGSRSALDEALARGVTVAADRFAIEERAIPIEELRDGIATSEVSLIVDRLAAGSAVLWR